MKRFFYHTLHIISFFLLLPMIAVPASGEMTPVGKVVAMRGDVFAVDSENFSRVLALKNDIYREDTVITGKNGRIQILFNDNTIISLGRESKMKISEYNWDAGKKDGEMKTEVKEGVFRIMGGAITKVAPEKFTTETPAATIGIRGSMYAGIVSEESLTVLFQGGKGIEIMNDNGSVAITQAGYGTTVQSLLEAPKPPIKFSAEDISKFEIEVFASANGIKTGDAEPEETGQKLEEPVVTEDEEIVEEEFIWDESDEEFYVEDELFEEDYELIEEYDLFDSYELEIETLEGVFTSITENETTPNYLGYFAILLDQRRGEIFGGGLPLIDSENDLGDPVIFEADTVSVNDDYTFETGLHPDRGEGQGIMISAEDQPLIDAVWGNWGMVYTSEEGEETRVSLNNSYWILGKATPGEFLASNRIGRDITATYQGFAKGAGIDPDGYLFALTNGETELIFNFMDQSVTGQIKFDEIIFNVWGEDFFGLLSSQEKVAIEDINFFFASIILNETDEYLDEDFISYSGNISGLFYNKNARSMGGNFISMQDGTQYFGIFGGNISNLDAPVFTTLSGKFITTLSPLSSSSIGDITGKMYANYIDFELSLQDGITLNFNVPKPESITGSEYVDTFTTTFERSFTLPNATDPLPLYMKFTYSNLGEFAIMGGKTDLVDMPLILGFAGLPSLTVPTEGISVYSGRSLFVETSGTESVLADMTTFINWQNQAVIGTLIPTYDTTTIEEDTSTTLLYLPDQPPLVFYVGRTEDSRITDINMFGFGTGDDIENITDSEIIGELTDGEVDTSWVDGQGTFGQIYGSENQGIGLCFKGGSYDVSSTPSDPGSSWEMTGAGFLKNDPSEVICPTGKEHWEGFIVGITEHTEEKLVGETVKTHQILTSDTPESFQFTVNKDTGDIEDGMITVTNLADSDYTQTEIHFGKDSLDTSNTGTVDAAYVDNQTIVAKLEKEDQNLTGFLATTPVLEDTVDESEAAYPEPEYLTWGYWGVSYEDQATGDRYNSLVNRSYWIAGQRTSEEDIKNLISQHVVGHYQGDANGIVIYPDQYVGALTNGATDIYVDFGSQNISGAINFDQVQMEIATTSLSTLGDFYGEVTGPDINYGQINGAFFGPQAANIGGNFMAEQVLADPLNPNMDAVTKYMGIFSGIKQ